MATIHGPDMRLLRTVKNLGWLLRHAGDVVRIDVSAHLPGDVAMDGDGWACVLRAQLADGRYYRTPWQSRYLCRQWLQRPSFRGVPLRWLGEETSCEVAPARAVY